MLNIIHTEVLIQLQQWCHAPLVYTGQGHDRLSLFDRLRIPEGLKKTLLVGRWEGLLIEKYIYSHILGCNTVFGGICLTQEHFSLHMYF